MFQHPSHPLGPRPNRGSSAEPVERRDPEIAHVVDLKFFCGFTFTEIADLRGVSERTVQRQWDKARIYLRHALRTELLG